MRSPRRSTSLLLTLAMTLVTSHAFAQKAARGGDADDDKGPDQEEREAKKIWEVGGIFETHRMVRQEDTGNGRNRVYNILYVHGALDLSAYDRLYVRGGAVQRFIGDPDETGIRLDDVLGKYTRYVPLPEKVDFRASASLYAPTSFSSQKSSLITEPRITLQVERDFGDLHLSVRGFGEYFWTKYRTAEGGSPNAKWRVEAIVDAEYSMPFHKPLAIGLSAFTGYLWFYDVESSKAPPTGVTGNPTFEQPIQQEYGGEAYVKYTLPTVVSTKSDISLSYMQGDGTSVLHDGVRQSYPFFYRNTSQVYVALSARY